MKSLNGHQVISSDDSDAVEKLTAKVAALQELQERMKAANKIIKSSKHSDEGKIYLLVEEMKYTPAQASKLLAPDYAGRIGYPSYALTNNNANMRTAKERLERLVKQQNTQDEEKEYGDIKIVHNATENRVQIFFPDKPADAVRTELKGCGFKWAPSNGCWQAFYSNRSKYMAERIVKALVPTEEAAPVPIGQPVSITYDEFVEKYKPIVNHIQKDGENGSYNGFYFETYGEEVEYIEMYAKTFPRNVWTMLTGTEAGDVLVSGYHYVNRFGYFITSVAFNEGEVIEINMESDMEEGEVREEEQV